MGHKRKGTDLIKRNAIGKEDRTPEDSQQEEFGPNAGREVFLCADEEGLVVCAVALTPQPAQKKSPAKEAGL